MIGVGSEFAQCSRGRVHTYHFTAQAVSLEEHTGECFRLGRCRWRGFLLRDADELALHAAIHDGL